MATCRNFCFLYFFLFPLSFIFHILSQLSGSCYILVVVLLATFWNLPRFFELYTCTRYGEQFKGSCIKGTEWMTKGFQICIQGTEQEYFPLDLWPVIQKRSNYRLRKCFVMSDQGDVNCQKSLNWNNLLYPATLTRLPPGPALLLAKTTPSLPLITTPWNSSLLVLSAWTSLRWKSKSAMLTTFCLKKSSPTFARRASGLAFHTQGKIGISNKDKNYYSYSLILYCCCFPPRDYVLFGNMVVMLLLPFLLISVLIIAFYETDKFL